MSDHIQVAIGRQLKSRGLCLSILALRSVLVTLLIVTVGVCSAASPRETPLVREIFVPFENLDVLVDAHPQRVFLSRSEYNDLLSQAEKEPTTATPYSVLLIAADYEATIAEGRAFIEANLTFDVLGPGVQSQRLRFEGVAIRTATLDGRNAPLGRASANEFDLFLEGPGRHSLQLGMAVPLRTTAAQQTLAFALPTPAATRLQLQVPGNVELRSGPPVLSRVVDAAAEQTRFELVPQRGTTELVMSLNNRLRRQQRSLAVRSVLVDEITRSYERLHATFSVDVLHGAVDRLQFSVPEDFEITSLSSPALMKWAVEADGRERVLDVYLREATTGHLVLNVAATRNHSSAGDWTMPQIVARDMSRHVSLVGVLLEENINAEQFTPRQLIPIDTDALKAALPPSVFEAEPGAPRLRPVSAFFAPRRDYALQARFVRPAAAFDADVNVLIAIDETSHRLQASINLSTRVETRSEFDVAIPDEWDVQQVRTADGDPFAFDRLPAADGFPARLHVRLPRGVSPRESRGFLLEAVRSPDSWFSDWERQQVDFPAISILGAKQTRGAIAFETSEDFEIRPMDTSGLLVLEDRRMPEFGLQPSTGSLAYQYEAANYSASMTILRRQPRMTARVLSFVRLDVDGFSAHYELSYDIEHGRTRELALSLPISTPTDVVIRGLDGLEIKQHQSRTESDRRIWTVQLAKARRGPARIVVDFKQPAQEEMAAAPIPLAKAENVDYQTGIVAVEGKEGFDCEVKSTGRRLDVGELVDAEYRVGRHLLGVFGVNEEDVTVTVNRRPAYALPAAIVQRCELVTLVSPHGASQTAARFTLRTKTSYLEVRLPDGAELWSAAVDGVLAAPQRDGDNLLLNLTADAGRELRDLQIVYQMPLTAGTVLTDVETDAPSLFVPGEANEDGVAVPVADVTWHLVLPSGQHLLRSNGTVFRQVVAASPSPLTRLAGALYRFAGGVGAPLALPQAQYAETTSEARSAPAVGALNDASATTDVFEGDDAESPSPPGIPQSQAGGAPSQAAAPAAVPQTQYWALEGVRSLPIQLERLGNQVTFESMGVEPRLRVTLLTESRLDFLSWSLALAVILYGTCFAPRSAAGKATFLLGTILVALVAPILIGALTESDVARLFDRPFFAAVGLIPWYLVLHVTRSAVGSIRGRVQPVLTATVVLALLSGMSSVCSAEMTAAELNSLRALLNAPPVELPPDAIIIPYDAASEEGVANADKVMVPYRKYLQLWSLAHPQESAQHLAPPAAYATSGMKYRVTLSQTDELLIEGSLTVDVFSEDDVEILLPLEEAVLTKAVMDGRPARIRVIAAQTPPAKGPRGETPVSSPTGGLLVVYAQGQGTKQIDFSLRVVLSRSGGWRRAFARLPIAGATQLTLTAPTQGTEILLSHVRDRASYETTQPGETIETVLGDGGLLDLRWRPIVAVGQVDRTLTASSQAVFDIQEDVLRLLWRADISLRQSQRESFTLVVPRDYLVEAVIGDNVRGWKTNVGSDNQQIDVTLLNPATSNESLTVRLTRAARMQGEPIEIEVPKVSIPDAVLHRGVLLVRRSPLIDVQTRNTVGLSRADTDQDSMKAVVATAPAESPLGIRAHQAFRFGSETFELSLRMQPKSVRQRAEVHAVLRLGADESNYEAKVNLVVDERPVYQVQIGLPRAFELQEVLTVGEYEWSVSRDDGDEILTVFFSGGRQGAFSLVTRGRFRSGAGADNTQLPRLTVLQAEQQQGFVVVQVDPAVNVRAEDLVNCESVLLSRVRGWLSEEQRRLSRLAIRYRGTDFSARLLTAAKQPRVSNFTITNVRVTSREVETTLFVRFDIQGAGIRTLTFQVPSWMSDARITVPQLRQRTVEMLDDGSGMARIRLELQDDVIGTLMVVVERDRVLPSGPIETRLSNVETGATHARFVVVENVGRDEVRVRPNDAIRELNRQQAEWRTLADVLGNGITQAFLVPDLVGDATFIVEAQQRVAVQTADARIRLAETLLLFDGHGAFRGSQIYRIDNKTEQYLQLRLPAGAELWTASVAGQLVKPSTMASDPTLVRIPLVKTAAGDLDYEVQIKYGGHTRPVGRLNRFGFPLIRTVNINVEESQVRLRLPESHRWFGFSGTMDRKATRGDLAAGFLSYQTRQIEALRRILASRDADKFTKVRAASNLKRAVKAAASYEDYVVNEFQESNERLTKELVANSAARQDAQQQILGADIRANKTSRNNRGLFRALGESQRTNRPRNAVTQLGDNFDSRTQQPQAAEQNLNRFNRDWIVGNNLSNQQAAEQFGRRFSQREAGQQNQMSKSQLLEIPQEAQDKSVQREVRPDQDGSGELESQLQRYQQRLEEAVVDEAQVADSDAAYLQMEMMGVDVSSSDGDESTGFSVGFSVADLGLTSLDVEFAERGQEYLFSTPRGEIEITARALDAVQLERGAQLISILLCVLGACLAWRVLSWLRRVLSLRAQAGLLVVIGCLSLLGIFPVAGAVCVALGAGLGVRSMRVES